MDTYEKKYKEALSWMQSLYNGLHGATKKDAEHFFPELKESEDEKIRKEILSFLRTGNPYSCPNSKRRNKWADWLEKQGGQKSIINDNDNDDFTINSTDYIDLGLPSGTLWKNSNEEDLLDYDTALGKYGDSLPTKEELEELKEQCKWEWSRNGYNVIGKNGNSIYLPAEGWCDSHGKLHLVDFDGHYWLSTPNDSVCVWRLSLDSSGVYIYHNDRSYGQSVRLVKRK